MIVFIHGVPETAAIWDKVRAEIAAESVALALPGFGVQRPETFGATSNDYAEWLADALGAFEEPVDLVGHDWGAGLTYRIATAHGDLVRSWVADVGSIAHPDYVWHDFAQLWQTPGEGEAFFAAQIAQPVEDRAVIFEMMGLSKEDALQMASAIDQTMSSCILDLYRSAMPNPHANWGPWTPTSAPGMIIHPSEDEFSEVTMATEVAHSLGARLATLDGAGHFWPYQVPKASAALLEEFWAGL